MPIIHASKVNDIYPEVKVGGKYELIEDVTKFKLPGVEYGDGEISGAGLIGILNRPDIYNPAAMELTLATRSLRDKATAALSPDGAEFRFAWAIQNLSASDAGADFDSYMATVKGWPKTVPGPEVEKGNPMETEFAFSVWYYKLTRNGRTIMEIDVLNKVLIINGIDYTGRLKEALGSI
jgi:hypothetical protein